MEDIFTGVPQAVVVAKKGSSAMESTSALVTGQSLLLSDVFV